MSATMARPYPATASGELSLNGSAWRTPTVVLVCGGLILLLAIGTRQSFGLFLVPMSLDLGWGRETFSFAIALQNLVWGLAMPFAGAIADRFGAARVLIAGGFAYAVGLWMMPYSTTALAFDLSAGLLVGLGLSCTGFGVVLSVVARAYPAHKRSRAAGIAGACGSFGQFAMLPWGQALITHFGWMNALLVLGAGAFLMVPLGAALAGRSRASEESEQPISAALAEAASHRGFWFLTLSFFVCGLQTVFMMTHLPAYLIDRGLSAADGMQALAIIGLSNIVGSYAASALGGRYSKKLVLAWMYVIRAVAITAFITLPLSAPSLYVFAVVVGSTWLGTVPLTNSLVAQIFGVKYLSTLFSIAFLGHQLGSFVGAWMGGAVFDLTGSYLPVWLASIALSVIAAALCVPIDERAIKRLAIRPA